MSDEEKYNLKNRLFKSLQYQQARIETNINKSFQNKYYNKELQDKLLIRKKLKLNIII